MAQFGLITASSAEDLPPLNIAPMLVLEAKSGNILAAEQAFTRWAPASLTKMMTAYTVFRFVEFGTIGMDSPVRISEEALAQPPSKMGFPIGTILTVETALKIIMVKSANDVSVALAESVAGSEEGFVGLMNRHAKRLGMDNTNFMNPHGLHDPQQYTTARDMAVLAKTLTEEFQKYDPFFDIPGIKIGGKRLRNHNALVERFPGTSGMKTGYVCASGFNLVARAERDDRELIAVVFGGTSGLARNVRTAKLLQEAFEGKHEPTGLNLQQFVPPADISKVPKDITDVLCPGKYAFSPQYEANSKPEARPADAPKADEFDAIDTQLPEDAVATEVEAQETADADKLEIKPTKRPVFAAADTKASDEKEEVKAAVEPKQDDEEVLEDAPPSIQDLAELYLTPRRKVREDVRLVLGGATGPNPNGILHTDGGVYVAPTPVPTKKPSEETN